MHVRAARRNGLDEDEIKEVLLQCAIYCGVPAANAAFAVAQRALAEAETRGGDMSTVELEQQQLLIGGEWTAAAGGGDVRARATRTRARRRRSPRPAGARTRGRAVDAAHGRVPRLGGHRRRPSGGRC